MDTENYMNEKSAFIAIVGRPNVGKSSLVNRLLGEERVMVSDIAGTTRDAVDSIVENAHGKFVFIAGSHQAEELPWRLHGEKRYFVRRRCGRLPACCGGKYENLQSR